MHRTVTDTHPPASTTSRRRRLVATSLLAPLVLVGVVLAGTSPADGAPPTASLSAHAPAPCATMLQVKNPAARQSRIPLGAATPHLVPGVCAAVQATLPPYNGYTAPLHYYGGYTAGTSDIPGKLVVTPIFWTPPAAQAFPPSYTAAITTFLADLAADSGSLSNPLALVPQYTNKAGQHLQYRIKSHTPIVTTDPPNAGTATCSPDVGPLYNDAAPYTSCITDAQIYAEVANVLAVHALPKNLAHAYPIFLPKGVEVCYYAQNASQGGNCSPTSPTRASFCAYHEGSATYSGATTSATLFLTMPYPVWNSPSGVTCGLTGAAYNQFPTGNPAADIQVNLLSHEVAETVTNPTGAGWTTAQYGEIGDLCQGTTGYLFGPAGQQWSSTINAHHYLLQGEFSNAYYAKDPAGGCQTFWWTPIAGITHPDSSPVGAAFLVSSRPSVDTSGAITHRYWYLDGTYLGRRATHSVTLSSTGTHTVTLVIEDSAGYTASASASITGT